MLLTGVRIAHTEEYFHQRPSLRRFGVDYGALFSALRAQGVRQVTFVDGGVDNAERMVNYNPQLRFYALLWRPRGLMVEGISPGLQRLGGTGGVVVSCDERYTQTLIQVGTPLAGIPAPCVGVRLRTSPAKTPGVLQTDTHAR